MESRLASKIDSTNSKVEKALDLVAEANTALDDLEMRMIATENNIEKKLADVESRLEEKMNTQVKTMVMNQLREAGFDPDLTAGALSTITQTRTGIDGSYASAVNKSQAPAGSGLQVTVIKEKNTKTQQERQEDRFWECRRSLRLWPVVGREGLDDYLKSNLNMDHDSIKDLGEVRVRKVLERKPRYKDEAIVTFEDKRIRDMVKAQAYKLANKGDDAGMRLHLPDHLQKSFRALMGLSYDMKKKFTGLKRSIKFDEDALDLYMDFQTAAGDDWRRIDALTAQKTNQRPGGNDPRNTMTEEDIGELLGGTSGAEDE